MAALIRLFSLFLFILMLSSPLLGKVSDKVRRWELSLCAMFQDEGPYLKEWIEYHKMVGVQHFFLYNNCSSDNYLEILTPYLKDGTVELMDWPSPTDQNWIHYQHRAYIHCLGKAIGQTKWLAVIDLDEFIVPVTERDLLAILKPLENRKEVGGLIAFWQIYGTSFCPKIPEGKLQIECLTRKGHPLHPNHRNVKTICRPDRVQEIHVHQHVYKPGYVEVTGSGNVVGPDHPIEIDQIRINHYWLRDEDYLFNTKIPRRERYEGRNYTQEMVDTIIQEYNEVDDPIISRFVPELKARLQK